MCTYCFCGDSMWRHDPPWRPVPGNPWHPRIPEPVVPTVNPPWDVNRLKEFQELLERIKKLEDQLDCDCVEPDKPNYIKLVKDRIFQLEQRVADKQNKNG